MSTTHNEDFTNGGAAFAGTSKTDEKTLEFYSLVDQMTEAEKGDFLLYIRRRMNLG